MLINRRGARAEPPETDPRFQVPAHGRPSPTSSNWGSSAVLLGATPAAQSKLLRLSGDASHPWQVTVAARYSGGASPVIGARVIGNFGSGGAYNTVEFDAKPDQTIQLPGAAIDLDVAWDVTYIGNAANVTQLIQPAVQASFLPARADISGVAVHGTTSRGEATRTRLVQTTVASNWLVDLPPYVDSFYVSCQSDAAYANITTLEFVTANDPAFAQGIVTYTGAQLLALKNAGTLAPVPGVATGFRLTTAGASLQWITFTLSL